MAIWLLGLGLLLAACGGERAAPMSAAPPPEVGEGEVRVGAAAPAFRLTATDGTVLDLSEMKGEAVVLNFWATWCGPCRLEMPELQAAHEAYRDRGLRLIAVEIRASGSPEESAAFLRERGVTFPNYRDATGILEERFIRRPAWPTTLFIDRDGVVRYVQVGPMDRPFIEERLSELGF